MSNEFDLEDKNEFDLETPAASKQEVVEASAPDSFLEDSAEATGGFVGGGIAGVLAGHGINKAGELAGAGANKLIESAGKLNKDQMDYITSDTKAYQAAPDWSTSGNTLRDLSDETSKAGPGFKQKALSALDELPEIHPDEYKKLIGNVIMSKQDDYSGNANLNEKTKLHEQNMSKVRPEIDSKAKASTELDAKMSQLSGQQYVSPHESKIKELEQLLAAPKADIPFEARQKAQTLLQDRRLQRIDEDLVLRPENRKLNNKKEDFVYTKKVNNEKTGTIKPHQDAVKLESMQKELAELKSKKIEGSAKAIAKKESDIKNMMKNKESMDTSIKSLAEGAKTSAEADFNKNILRTPDDIRAVTPGLENRSLLPHFEAPVEDAAKMGRGVTGVKPRTLATGILDRLTDQSSFEHGASSVDKFNTDLRGKVRSHLGDDKFGAYDENMGKSAVATKASIDKFGKGLGMAPNAEGKLTFPENKRKQLANILVSGPDEFIDEKAMLNSLPDDLSKLGLLPEDAKLIQQLKTSALKQAVKDTTIFDKGLAGYDVANSVKSPTGIIKPAFDKYSTKLQEAVALSKGGDGLGLLSKAGTAAGAVGKALPGILGVGGAILGATSAAQAGELSPAAATVAGGLDIINPLPLDTVQGAVQAKKGYNDNIDEQKMTEEYFNGGNVSQSSAILAGAKGGAQGLVQPAIDLGQMVGQAGTEKSLDARSRMEQQMKSLDSLKPKEDPKKGNDFLNFVAKKPEALKELADQLTGAGQSFAGPLNKAAEGSESQRAAILFGLYQQPAFRSLIGEGSLLNQNIPGVKKKDEDELTAVKVPRPM